MQQKFISYCRVSTIQQGRSGLGLDAQKAAVAGYMAGRGELVGEYVEVETGKGWDALTRRPQLQAALIACKKGGATLLIAKLDRLARNVHFVSGLLESGCDFVAADLPGANKVMIQMHAVMSEWERDQISARTKDALKAAKARGTILGASGPANLKRNIQQRQEVANLFSESLKGLVAGCRARGLSQRSMVTEFNNLKISAPRGGQWSLPQVQRILHRIDKNIL